jgi:hypothetical protein
MLVGGSIFLVTETRSDWYFRPALSFARSVLPVASGSTAFAINGAGRFDVCRRLAGNYLEQRGIQLDLCGGSEAGLQHVDPVGANGSVSNAPFWALGPSLDLRGELATALSVLFRGVGEVNVLGGLPEGQGSPGWLIARAEVGLSWRFR